MVAPFLAAVPFQVPSSGLVASSRPSVNFRWEMSICTGPGAIHHLQHAVRNQGVQRLLRQSVTAGEGESTPDVHIDIEDTRAAGEAEVPVDFVGPLRPPTPGLSGTVSWDRLQPDVARSSSFHPTITVMTPGTRMSDSGGYTYKVEWGSRGARRRRPDGSSRRSTGRSRRAIAAAVR